MKRDEEIKKRDAKRKREIERGQKIKREGEGE
jgi:hypothetical protein